MTEHNPEEVIQMDDHGNVIGHFDNMEAFFEWQRQQDEKADRQMHDRQRSITFGSKAIRFYFTGGQLLVIFGDVYSEQVMREKEIGAGSSIDEWLYTWTMSQERDRAGYCYGWWSSIIDEEPGSAHKINLWPINDEFYEYAKECRWDWYAFDSHNREHLQALYDEYAAHMQGVVL